MIAPLARAVHVGMEAFVIAIDNSEVILYELGCSKSSSSFRELCDAGASYATRLFAHCVISSCRRSNAYSSMVSYPSVVNDSDNFVARSYPPSRLNLATRQTMADISSERGRRPCICFDCIFPRE